jgi:MoaA/NifB/PqqE/SkfB family radical SAM enzyme
MKIHNVRMDFATNSSSSHSLIFLKSAKEDLVGEDCFDFGWEFFTATKKKTRRIYLGHLIASALREVMDHKTIPIVLKELVGYPVDHDWRRNEREDWGYIDHQSIYMIPLNWTQNGPDYEFIEDLKEFFLQKDLVILGGNDNEDDRHPLDNGNTFLLPLPIDVGRSTGFVARKDPQGFWTLFSRHNGNKIRFSFPTPTNPGEVTTYEGYRDNAVYGYITPSHSTYPELIDIKITDFCTKGCEYCYQGSSPGGLHAKVDYSIFMALSDMKVFEVAIGGGEPLDHPGFVGILDGFKREGIVPNFSTKKLGWLRDPILSHQILKNTGSFAYSTQSIDELKSFASLMSAQGINNRYSIKPTVHYVMGTAHGDYQFKAFLENAYSLGVHVVLLGFKDMGRGQSFKNGWHYAPYNYWLDVVQELRDTYKLPRLSIDTALASEYSEGLDRAGVDQIMYHTEEGKFSMYIDLVNGKMGPSSFCAEEELLDLKMTYSDNIKDQIAEAFSLF